MKHSSLWLTVLLLAGTPLAAAAVDYGANAPLLAADANAPQLPGAQVDAAARGEMPRPDYMAPDANEPSGGAPSTVARQRMTPSSGSSRTTPTTGNPGPTATNRPRVPEAHSALQPSTATWQSLLPGSIQ
jgi:hypothetical protein